MRRLAVFASGSGTNFEAIVSACEQGVTGGEVVLMFRADKITGPYID